jgi:PIN domain nuclease of toxin-antitoxin system
MPGLVLDTHAVLWYVQASPRLSAKALVEMQTATQQGEPLLVSSVSLVEIIYLVEKGRISAPSFRQIYQRLQQSNSDLVPIAFDAGMADTLRQIPNSIVPDMPDRMIAATALHLNVPLVTCDQRIQAAPLQTVW